MTEAEIVAGRLRSQRLVGSDLMDPRQVVACLGAVQAQDYPATLWAVGLRLAGDGAGRDRVEAALADGSVVRTWLFRGTIHLVAAEDVHWMSKLVAPRLIARSASRFRQMELDERVVSRSQCLFVEALRGGHARTRGEMYALLEEAGISTAGQRGYHLLWRAAMDGVVCWGARRGEEHTFTLLDEWVRARPVLEGDEALGELALRYFSSRGPASAADFIWWSGVTTAEARTGLEIATPRLVRGTERRTERGTDLWMAAHSSPEAPRPPAARLLPAFDEYLVGYRDRSAVLDPGDVRRVNAGGGMLSPTVLLNGRVAGVWRRAAGKKTVRIRVTPFRALQRAELGAIENTARSYGRFLGTSPELSFDEIDTLSPAQEAR